jgi:hypothetical protein
MDLVNCTLDENCDLHYLPLTPVFSHQECVNRVTYALKEIIMTECSVVGAQNGKYESENISEDVGNTFYNNTSSISQENWKLSSKQKFAIKK